MPVVDVAGHAPDRYFTPCQRQPFNARNEGSNRVSMMWQATFKIYFTSLSTERIRPGVSLHRPASCAARSECLPFHPQPSAAAAHATSGALAHPTSCEFTVPRVKVAPKQWLTLVHFSAQLKPCLTHKSTIHTMNTP